MSSLAVKVGARVSHSPVLGASSSAAVLCAAASASVVGPSGLGGAAAASFGKGVGGGKGAVSLADMLPTIPHGVLAVGAPTVSLGPGGIPVPVGTPVVCSVHALAGPQLLAQGAATVFVGGVPIARVADTLSCGAVLCDGLPGVAFGGPGGASAPSLHLPSLAGALGGVTLATRLRESATQLSVELGAALAGFHVKVQQAAQEGVEAVTSGVGHALDAATDLAGQALATAQGALGSLLGAKLS